MVSFPERGVSLVSAQVKWPPSVGDELAREIQQLSTALAMLRSPPLWPVLQNPGFELSAPNRAAPVGWLLLGPAEATAELDAVVKRSGNFSLRLRSPRPGATLVSHPFQAPSTGRLAVRVHFRPGQTPPRLRLALEGRTVSGTVTILGEVLTPTAASGGSYSPPTEFQFVDLETTDLPTNELQAIRLRLDLADPGELWLDDVLLSQVAFSRVELVELMKLVAPAEAQVAQGKYAEPLRLLDSPWSLFLKRYVVTPMAPSYGQPVAAVAEAASPSVPPPPSEPSSNPFLRMWEWLPRRLRLF